MDYRGRHIHEEYLGQHFNISEVLGKFLVDLHEGDFVDVFALLDDDVLITHAGLST